MLLTLFNGITYKKRSNLSQDFTDRAKKSGHTAEDHPRGDAKPLSFLFWFNRDDPLEHREHILDGLEAGKRTNDIGMRLL